MIAPASLLSAVLFYFGYVSSRAQYEYFDVDVDAVGLGTQDYVMRSPQPLLVPLIVLALLGAGLLITHVAGMVLLGAGVLVLFGYPLVGRWACYTLVTPLLLAAGGGLTGYLAWLRARTGSCGASTDVLPRHGTTARLHLATAHLGSTASGPTP